MTALGTINSRADILAIDYRATTSTTSLSDSDDVLECTSGTFTVTLHDPTTAVKKMYRISNSGNGVITFSRSISGDAAFYLINGESIDIFPNGTEWTL